MFWGLVRSRNLLLERADSQRDAELFANLAALLDFFFGHHFFYNGHHDVWHMELGECCKFLQRVKGLQTESRSCQREEFFGGRRVQRNRNGVEAAIEFFRDVAAVNQIRKAVRVEANFQIRVFRLQQVDDFADIVQAFERFAVSAKNELIDDGQIVCVENFHYSFDARFSALEPERVAFHHLLRLAQAKDATAWAAVGHVHVDVLARDVTAVRNIQVAGFSDVSCHSVNNH